MPARPWGAEGLCTSVQCREFVDPLALPRLHVHPVMQPDGCTPGSSEAGNRWPNVSPGQLSNPKCHTAQPGNVRIWNRDTGICKLKLASRQLRSVSATSKAMSHGARSQSVSMLHSKRHRPLQGLKGPVGSPGHSACWPGAEVRLRRSGPGCAGGRRRGLPRSGRAVAAAPAAAGAGPARRRRCPWRGWTGCRSLPVRRPRRSR